MCRPRTGSGFRPSLSMVCLVRDIAMVLLLFSTHLFRFSFCSGFLIVFIPYVYLCVCFAYLPFLCPSFAFVFIFFFLFYLIFPVFFSCSSSLLLSSSFLPLLVLSHAPVSCPPLLQTSHTAFCPRLSKTVFTNQPHPGPMVVPILS